MHEYVVISMLFSCCLLAIAPTALLAYLLLRVGMQIAAQLVLLNNKMDAAVQAVLTGSGAVAVAQPPEEPLVRTPVQRLMDAGWRQDPAHGMLWVHEGKPGVYFSMEQAFAITEEQ